MANLLNQNLFFAVFGCFGINDRENDPDIKPDHPLYQVYKDQSLAVKRVAQYVKSQNPDFILSLGDNAYPSGNKPRSNNYDIRVGQLFAEYIFPYKGQFGPGASINRYITLVGSHDTMSLDAFQDYFPVPPPDAEPEAEFDRFSVKKGDNLIEIFAINSEKIKVADDPTKHPHILWLKNALQNSTARWKIVALHAGPYTIRTRYPGAVDLQLPYAQWGANLVIWANEHGYERYTKDNIPMICSAYSGRYAYKIKGNYKELRYCYGSSDVQSGKISTTALPGVLWVQVTLNQLLLNYKNVNNLMIDSVRVIRKRDGTTELHDQSRLTMTKALMTSVKDLKALKHAFKKYTGVVIKTVKLADEIDSGQNLVLFPQETIPSGGFTACQPHRQLSYIKRARLTLEPGSQAIMQQVIHLTATWQLLLGYIKGQGYFGNQQLGHLSGQGIWLGLIGSRGSAVRAEMLKWPTELHQLGTELQFGLITWLESSATSYRLILATLDSRQQRLYLSSLILTTPLVNCSWPQLELIAIIEADNLSLKVLTTDHHNHLYLAGTYQRQLIVSDNTGQLIKQVRSQKETGANCYVIAWPLTSLKLIQSNKLTLKLGADFFISTEDEDQCRIIDLAGDSLISNSKREKIYSLKVDPVNPHNLYVIGTTLGKQINFTTQIGSDRRQGFVLRLNHGRVVWSHLFSSMVIPRCLEVDQHGRLHIFGHYYRKLVINDQKLSCPHRSAFYCQIDTNGYVQELNNLFDRHKLISVNLTNSTSCHFITLIGRWLYDQGIKSKDEKRTFIARCNWSGALIWVVYLNQGRIKALTTCPNHRLGLIIDGKEQLADYSSNLTIDQHLTLAADEDKVLPQVTALTKGSAGETIEVAIQGSELPCCGAQPGAYYYKQGLTNSVVTNGKAIGWGFKPGKTMILL